MNNPNCFIVKDGEVYIHSESVLGLIDAFYHKNAMDAKNEEAKKLLKEYHEQVTEMLDAYVSVTKKGDKNATY